MSDENDNNLAQLRLKAERADQLEAELALRDKQDAFRTAGLDPTSGPGKLVFDTFKPADGEKISPESVLTFASQYGVAPTPPAAAPEIVGNPQGQPPTFITPPPNLNPAEVAHFQQINAGQAGSEPNPMSAPLVQQVQAAYNDERKRGVPHETAAVAGIAAIIGSAASGNKEALYDGEAWRSQGGS